MSGSKSSSGSKGSIDVNKLIKIENILPGNLLKMITIP